MENLNAITNAREIIIKLGSNLCNNFNLDDPIRLDIYKKAYYVFTGGEKAKELEIDPNKGILLAGNVGVGKTTLFKVMQKSFLYTRRRFKWLRAPDLAMAPKKEAFEILNDYGKGYKGDIVIDDLDFIDEKLPYSQAKPSEFIVALLNERYELFCTEGFKTHISLYIPNWFTHQYSHSSLNDLYSPVIMDRVKEMTNLLVWEGKSLRESNWPEKIR